MSKGSNYDYNNENVNLLPDDDYEGQDAMELEEPRIKRPSLSPRWLSRQMGIRHQDQSKRMNLQVYPTWLSRQMAHSLFPSLLPHQAQEGGRSQRRRRETRPLWVLSPLSSRVFQD